MISLAQWLGFSRPNKLVIVHDSPNATHLETIPDNSDFTRKEHSGLTTVTGSVGRNVTLTILGNNNLKIIGAISSACKILKEGNGTLTFEGIVAADLELTVYGRGDITFTQQPSEEVIRSINNRSGIRIICAGMILPQPIQGYRHHNLNRLPRHSLADDSHQQTTRALSQLSNNSSSVRPSQVEEAIDHYLPSTQKYIERCHQSSLETIAVRISKLNLTEEELPLFDGFKDCIMMSYFDDIPVMYDEKYYNLSTLLELYKNSKPDPFSRDPLRLAGISPARTLLNNFDNAVLELNKKRETATRNNRDHKSAEEAQASVSLSHQ